MGNPNDSVITISIIKEQAEAALDSLRRKWDDLRGAATQTGATMDASMAKNEMTLAEFQSTYGGSAASMLAGKNKLSIDPTGFGQVANDTRTIAANFTGLIGSGRALMELGRAGGILAGWIGDKDLQRISQASIMMGDLVMVAGRLPQVYKAIGGAATVATLGILGAGAVGVDLMAQISKQTPEKVAQGPFSPFAGIGTQAGLETHKWLVERGFPDFSKLGQQVDYTSRFANAAAVSLAKFNNAIFDTEVKMEKMTAGQLQAANAIYSGMEKLAGGAMTFMGMKSPFADLSRFTQQQIPVAQARETPLGKLRQDIAEGTTTEIDKLFPKNALDLTKYSQQELNQAKQLSLQLAQQELEAIRAQAQALGLNVDEINKIVEARRKELDATTLLVQEQGKSTYLTGAVAANIQDALSRIKTQEKQQPNFNFQRLQDISPADFGNIAARAMQYNAMLTRLGDPSKNENITLMLGQEGVFKSLSVRLMALQLALEDQTKVAKAQLSGTWNLPSGATALVPISSLDLQRWNKHAGGGGGFDLASLEALNKMSNTLGGTVAGGMMQVSDPATHQLLAQRTGQQLAEDYSMKNWTSRFAPIPSRPTPLQPQTASWLERYAPVSTPNTNFNIQLTATPLKVPIQFTSNVMLNGAILARSLSQNMFQLMTQFFRGSGLTPRGILR